MNWKHLLEPVTNKNALQSLVVIYAMHLLEENGPSWHEYEDFMYRILEQWNIDPEGDFYHDVQE